MDSTQTLYDARRLICRLPQAPPFFLFIKPHNHHHQQTSSSPSSSSAILLSSFPSLPYSQEVIVNAATFGQVIHIREEEHPPKQEAEDWVDQWVEKRDNKAYVEMEALKRENEMLKRRLEEWKREQDAVDSGDSDLAYLRKRVQELEETAKKEKELEKENAELRAQMLAVRRQLQELQEER